jgi:hypothetical protein
MHASACLAESRDPAHMTGLPRQSPTVLPASLPASTATARSQVLLSGNPVQIASVTAGLTESAARGRSSQRARIAVDGTEPAAKLY